MKKNLFKMYSISVGLFCSAVSIQADPAKNNEPFPDISPEHWSYDSVIRMAQAGVIEGDPQGFLNGNKNLTRYEFVVAMTRLTNFSRPDPRYYFRQDLERVESRLKSIEDRLANLENKLNATPTVVEDFASLHGD